MSLKALAFAVAMVGLSSANASAQFVVTDVATTAQNRITAVLKELQYQVQVRQHDRIFEMARRLSALTNLRKYALSNVPRWRTHGGDFFFAMPYLDALTSGDSSGAAYARMVATLEQAARVTQLPPSARRAFLSRLAIVEGMDAIAMAASHTTGQFRLGGRRTELQAIDDLESDVVDPSAQQSATAVLDKISGASLVGARQRQARIQLLSEVLEQLLADNKQMRDSEAAVLNMQLVRWRDGRAADAAFVAGSGDALRAWRQP
jgi:hypothetical protein